MSSNSAVQTADCRLVSRQEVMRALSFSSVNGFKKYISRLQDKGIGFPAGVKLDPTSGSSRIVYRSTELNWWAERHCPGLFF